MHFFFSSYSHRVSILFSLLFSAPKLTVFRNSPAKLSHLLSSPTTLSLREQSGQSPPVWSDKKAFKPRRILIWESGLVPLCPAFNTLPLFPAVLLFLELCLLWLWASWPVDQIVVFFLYNTYFGNTKTILQQGTCTRCTRFGPSQNAEWLCEHQKPQWLVTKAVKIKPS